MADDAFINHLKSLSPSSTDLEIRSLHQSDEMIPFVRALTSRLRKRRDYELVQAWMTVFLRLHSEDVMQDDVLIESLKQWRSEQEKEGRRLGELVGYCSGVVGFLRSTRR